MARNMRTNLALPLRISGGGWSNPGSSSSIPQDDPRDERLGEATRGLTHPGNNEHITNLVINYDARSFAWL